ncbi:hypothetical protein PIB30_061582 [Stylosanthes scabra]|uniref:Uncharacterized protein n=1 Tax=Stylosanthes scabra TaxID=79078 RepID=A0ABU6QLC8_9FABA|nr:hypothetical protein [Stylosanthes scabra]
MTNIEVEDKRWKQAIRQEDESASFEDGLSSTLKLGGLVDISIAIEKSGRRQIDCAEPLYIQLWIRKGHEAHAQIAAGNIWTQFLLSEIEKHKDDLPMMRVTSCDRR